jgi:GNAT superfamily N-acetyltransferase
VSILDEVIIREYKEGDEVQINLLHNQQYGTNRGAEEWRWEFRNGPYGESIFVVAEHNGEIIGTQALLPIMITYGGAKILTAKSEETLLKQSFRGYGVFQQLYNKCFELAKARGIALIWGITNAEKPFRKAGFQVLRSLNHDILIIDPYQSYKLNAERMFTQVKERISWKLGQKLLLRCFILVSFMWYKINSCKYKVKASLVSDIEVITQADRKLDVFAEEFNLQSKSYSVFRTADYLNWRLFNNPNMIYHFLAATCNNTIRGYIVLGSSKRENMGQIADFCVLDKNFKEVTELLLSNSINYFRSQKVAYIDTWRVKQNPESRKYSSYLWKYGFFPVPMGSCIVLKVLADGGSFPTEPSDLGQWFITEIFSEGVG